MGAASPLGLGVETFWERLLAGDSGVDVVQDMDLSKSGSRIGAQVRDFIPEDHFSAKEIKRLSRSTLLAILAGDEAMAGHTFPPEGAHRRGVLIGSSIAGFTASEAHFEEFYAGPAKGNPFIVSKVMNNAPASNLSIRYGFKGPLISTDSACASAAHAVGYAYQSIKHGLLDTALVGGSDSALSPAVVQAWWRMRVLSSREDTPQEACRPFSLDRDGIVLGEGAGIMLIESERSAKARGANILAEISGYSATSDGHHITQPSEEGPREALRLAIEDAGLSPQDIDYINAHATGTRWNDENETNVIKKVLGEHAYEIPVVGIKGAIGHSIAASGALELVSVILSLRDQMVPPTINLKAPDPACDLDYVSGGKRAADIQHAASNSFAFGGSNGVLVVSRYTE